MLEASKPGRNVFQPGCSTRRVHVARAAWCTAAAICGAVLPALRTQIEDSGTHGQVVITTLTLHKQPSVALVQQNCQCLSVAEKGPVCISDGF